MPTVDEALQQELLQRAMAANHDIPTIPSTEFGSRVPDNYGVRRALDMLHKKGLSAGMPLININSPQNKRVRAMLKRTSLQHGYVRSGESVININDFTKMYRNASKGNEEAIRQLAGLLAHERYHVDTGSDELAAYDRQLEVLNLLGGQTNDIEKTRSIVLRENKK